MNTNLLLVAAALMGISIVCLCGAYARFKYHLKYRRKRYDKR